MPQKVTQYKLLISCPGDIKEEVGIIDQVIDQFNELYSNYLGISIQTCHWKKSSYAQSGAKPQQLINKQMVDDCDAAVAIMWTRFGTPTEQYGSGSEEEIQKMLDSGKQVFMFFSDKAKAPSEIDGVQHSRVIEFREKYKGQGLYFTYSTDEEFHNMLFAQLSKYFLTLQKGDDLSNLQCPKLVIKSISEEKLLDYGYIVDLKFDLIKDSNELLMEIKKLYNKISENKQISKTPMNNAIWRMVDEKVEISEATRKNIIDSASALSIIISETNFFELGDLTKNKFSSLIGEELYGTKTQKEKYRDILYLDNIINHYYILLEFETCYKGLKCIKFIIINEGTSFDEDIEIKLNFENDMLLPHSSFNVPDSDILSIYSDYFSLDDLFQIRGTASFNDYSSSIKPFIHPVSMPSDSFPLFKKDYRKEYLQDMDNLFDYDYYISDSSKLLKLHIDYIKQHTAIAFPTPIFINSKYSDISYTITSKYHPDEIFGTIRVSDKIEKITPPPPTSPSPPPPDPC